MADHQHYWKESYLDIRRVSMLQIKCVGCGEIMDHEDIASRLNALEEIKVKGSYPAPSIRGFVISNKKVILYPTEAHDRTSADSG